MKIQGLDKLSESFRMFFPIIYILVLSILFYISLTTGIKKIAAQKREIKSSEKVINVLTEKVKGLREFSSKYDLLYQSSLAALPTQPSILFTYSQLRRAASDNNVILNDVSLGKGNAGLKGLSQNGISFNAVGSFDDIISFFRTINNSAPINLIDKIDVNASGGELSVDVKLTSFWAPFSGKVPPITSPLSSLTQEDKLLLDEVSSLRPPLINEVVPQNTSGRTDPFQ